MAKRNDSVILDVLGLLSVLPWWVSVVVSGISYLLLKYLIPLIEFHQKGPADFMPALVNGLTGILAALAPFIALVLLIPAPISIIRSWQKRRTSDISSSRLSTREPSSKPMAGRRGGRCDIVASEDRKQKVDLSMATLRKIEWYSFELFCKIYYENIGFRVAKTKAGADGGMDLVLYKNDSEHPCAVVQCKARANQDIGVKYVRELLGVMAHYKVGNGILVTNSGFTQEAVEFARTNPIEVIDGRKLSALASGLDAEKKTRLLDFLESNDYTTPTCPNCEIKQVIRTAKKGQTAGQEFWGCRNYPRCRYHLHMNNVEG